MTMFLIQDVRYPTIRQDTIQIDHTANDPIPTFRVRLQDDPSRITLTELMEVVIIDEGLIANPTHNLLQNPIISPFTSKWTQVTTTGGSFANANPGVLLTASNAVGSFGLTQNTQRGAVVVGQSYMFSCTITPGTMTNCVPYLSIVFLDIYGNTLATQTNTFAVATARQSLSSQVPMNATTIQIGLGIQPTSGTNSGTATFTNAQLEPMTFTSGNYQLIYPTPFCASGQPNSTLMPDGTSIRQYRLFGGLITKATAGNYIGNNRQLAIEVAGYAWLLQKQQLNTTYTNTATGTIISNLVATYFSGTFLTTQVATGPTLNAFGYTYNGTARDAMNELAKYANFLWFIDPYRVIWFQPPGYNQLGFTLSDYPDNVISFPYYNYTYSKDATQLGNVTLVTGASGISAIEYDAASIGFYNQVTNGQGTFWRVVNDSSITTTTQAQQRAIAENTQWNFATKVIHLTTQQIMITGYTVLFSSRTDALFNVSLLVQKVSLILKGFQTLKSPVYECKCELGPFLPDLVNISIKMFRKLQVSSNSIGTPIVGLMVTENFTFIDSIQISRIISNPSTYGTGIYGTNTYYAAGGAVPTTTYGGTTATYGNMSVGYN